MLWLSFRRRKVVESIGKMSTSLSCLHLTIALQKEVVDDNSQKYYLKDSNPNTSSSYMRRSSDIEIDLEVLCLFSIRALGFGARDIHHAAITSCLFPA